MIICKGFIESILYCELSLNIIFSEINTSLHVCLGILPLFPSPFQCPNGPVAYDSLFRNTLLVS